jgi:hypothetical protein
MIFFRSQRRLRLTILFATLFICAVFIQLGVGWYQRQANARNYLYEAVDEVRRELRYSTRWDLTRLRQSVLDPSYYIIDKSGFLIDFTGFVAEFGFRADLTNLQPGLQTVIEPRTNETWRLFLEPVMGGLVILGISPPEDITRVDERLQENAKRFGKSLEDADRITASDLDRNIWYIVLDDNRRVKFALGGIPLKLIDYPKLPLGVIKEIRSSKGPTYGLLSVPFKDASGQMVGTITVFDELSPLPWLSLHAWLINLSASLMLAFAGTSIGARYIHDPFRPDQLLREALQSGESSAVEFKEALRWEAQQDQPGDPRKFAEAIAIKTIAGFLNSRLGGTLFIGIADDKRIVGLDRDYESLVKLDQNRIMIDKARDKFQLRLQKLLADTIGPEISNLCVEIAILTWDGKDVCIVGVRPSPRPVYVDGVKGRTFYLRDGPSTIWLDVEDAVAYCQKRWPRPLWTRFHQRTR